MSSSESSDGESDGEADGVADVEEEGSNRKFRRLTSSEVECFDFVDPSTVALEEAIQFGEFLLSFKHFSRIIEIPLFGMMWSGIWSGFGFILLAIFFQISELRKLLRILRKRAK